MSVAKGGAVLLTALIGVLSHYGCEREAGEPASTFFWPLQEGKSFVYEASAGVHRTIQIVKVTHQNDQRILVETEERMEGSDSTGSFRQPRRALWELDLANDIIRFRSMPAARSAAGITLRGPVRKGTTWVSEFVMSGPVDEGTPTEDKSQRKVYIKAKGVCRITGMVQRSVLGQQVQCAQYSCPLESKELSVTEDGSNCRGVGRMESSVTIVYKNGRQEPFTHSERLIDIQ